MLFFLNVQIPDKLSRLVVEEDISFDWIKKTQGQNDSLLLEKLDNDHGLPCSRFLRNQENLSDFLEKALIVFQGSGSSACMDFHHKVQMFGQMILFLDPLQPQQIAKQLVSFLEQETENIKNESFVF